MHPALTESLGELAVPVVLLFSLGHQRAHLVVGFTRQGGGAGGVTEVLPRPSVVEGSGPSGASDRGVENNPPPPGRSWGWLQRPSAVLLPPGVAASRW